jgi:muramidase (phage lysozyme)
MALIQTAGYAIGKIGTMFSPKTGEGNAAKKAVLKKTKVRREVIARNKIVEKRRVEKRKKIEKESLLESVKTKGKSGLSKLLSVSDPGGIFQKTLDFIGILLLGWMVDKLPQIIDWVKDLIKRIRLLVSSLKSLIKNFGNWFRGLGDLFKGTLDNIRRFDFTDSQGKVKKAMSDMENAFKGMQNDIKNVQTAIGGDVEQVQGQLLDPSQLAGDTPEAKAWLATINSVEANNPDRYNTLVGGQVVPELTQMTIQEVYDMAYGREVGKGNLPARLGGREVTYGASSHAAGGYQFHPDTMLARAKQTGMDPKTTLFTAANQQKLALAHLVNLGVNPNQAMTSASLAKAGSTAGWEGLSVSKGKITEAAAMSRYQGYLEQAGGAGDGRQARGANQTPAYQRAVAVGRALEGQGYRAWQHPDFNVHSGYTGSGRERVMRRSFNSYHNYGEALDYPLSHNSEAQLNKLAAYFRQNKSALGVAEILWKTSGHFDHLHVSFKGGGSIDKKLAGVPSLKGAGQRQKIVIIEEEPAPAPVASGGSGGGVIIIANDSLNRFMKNQLLSELAYT